MKPFISMRLGEEQQNNPEDLKTFVKLFKKNPGSCDEVWFSTYYGYPSLQKHKKMAGNIIKAAEYIRANGISVSLQISNTIGHGSVGHTADRMSFNWRPLAGHDGTISRFCSCPRDSRFLDYITETTTHYAKCLPDFVWIDDDLRMSNHAPVKYGCFCPVCLELFNEENNSSFTRDDLVSAINGDIETRIRFIGFNQRSLAGVVRAVADGVMEQSPDSRIGIQMTTYASTTYNGDTFDFLMGKIMEYTGKPAAIRPGGGFYDDHSPRDVFRKGLKLSSATDRMPGDVKVSQAEIENIPHTFTGKSAAGTLLESAVYLAYGCTSLSFSAFMTRNEPIGFYERLFSKLSKRGDFLRKYQEHNEDTVNGGAGIIFSKTHNKKPGNMEIPFDWTGYKGEVLFKLQEFGIPLSWNSSHTPVKLLHFSEVDALSDDEINELFSKGVITDAQSVEKLNKRGLGNILNLDVDDFYVMNCCEKASEHHINGAFKGQIWHNYYTPRAAEKPMLLSPKDKTAEILGYYVKRFDQSVTSGISSLILPTSKGGKAAVFSYNPWSHLVNTARWNQLISCLDILGDRKMPVRLKDPSQTVVIPRVNKSGQLKSVMLVNISLDTLESPEIYLRIPENTSFSIINQEKNINASVSMKTEDGLLVKLPDIKPWELICILVD